MDSGTFLQRDCTGHRIDNRGKFNDSAIAHQLDEDGPYGLRSAGL